MKITIEITESFLEFKIQDRGNEVTDCTRNNHTGHCGMSGNYTQKMLKVENLIKKLIEPELRKITKEKKFKRTSGYTGIQG